MMKTVVLDDDPTGTQCAQDVTVLLEWDADAIAATLRHEAAVFLQTNSRSLGVHETVALAERIRAEIAEVALRLGATIDVVLRGDSTLRGHVVDESAVFADDSPVLFVPAFPAAGRVTRDGVHSVVIDGTPSPVAETEFARDPVFGFTTSDVPEFLRRAGVRSARSVPLDALRATRGRALIDALSRAVPGEYIVPDVVEDDDLETIAAVVRTRRSQGLRTTVRCAAPLAAMLAGCYAQELLSEVPGARADAILVACGSHTAASTAQLATLTARSGVSVHVLDAEDVRRDPVMAGTRAASSARGDLGSRGLAIVASERERRSDEGSLDDGARVMAALLSAVQDLAAGADTVVTKGGITAAEVIRRGLGARSARVMGPLYVGVPVWELGPGSTVSRVVIVPGNIGRADLLADVVGRV